MSDDEVKMWKVYCITKKVPDENYDMYVGSTDRSLISTLNIYKHQSKHLPYTKLYKRMQEVGPSKWEINAFVFQRV